MSSGGQFLHQHDFFSVFKVQFCWRKKWPLTVQQNVAIYPEKWCWVLTDDEKWPSCVDWFLEHLRSIMLPKEVPFERCLTDHSETGHMELKVNYTFIFFFKISSLKFSFFWVFLAQLAPSIKGVSSVEKNFS